MMALMGALCSPMAYVTLKATGQSAPAALVAATLVAFGTLIWPATLFLSLWFFEDQFYSHSLGVLLLFIMFLSFFGME